MFTDYEPEPMDDNEIDREDLEECVLEQMLKDIGSGLVGEVLHSLSNLSQDALLCAKRFNDAALCGTII